MRKLLLLLLFFFVFNVGYSHAATIFTYQAPESKTDKRRDYIRDLLNLALEKTVAKYGPYKLVPSPSMNSARSLRTAKENKFPNFFVRQSAHKEILDEMGYVPFPVEGGIVGYRVFFVSPKVKQQLKEVKSLEQLKKFTIGQGIGWLDTHILRASGFKVIVGGSYEGLFQMVAQGRVNLFGRGTNELLDEYESHKEIEGLMYDESIVLYYPLPRFFFTSKENVSAIKRVHEGLIAAYEDGEVQKLWKKYYGPSIEFVNLKKRKIFRIDNPFLKGIDTSYEKYIYNP